MPATLMVLVVDTAVVVISPMSVPPPPRSSICEARLTRFTEWTCASHVSTRTFVPLSPTFCSKPSTSARTRPRRSPVIEPEVSHTMATSGMGRTRVGMITDGVDSERLEGLRYE
jgi:hypothetical protein